MLPMPPRVTAGRGANQSLRRILKLSVNSRPSSKESPIPVLKLQIPNPKLQAPKKFQRPKLQTPGLRSNRPWERIRETQNGCIALADGWVIPSTFNTVTHGYAVTSLKVPND